MYFKSSRYNSRRKLSVIYKKENLSPVTLKERFYNSNIVSLITIHMNIYWEMEAWKWSLSIRVDSGTFTCIEGSAPRHAWGLGGWVADGPLRCYQTNAHDRKNGCNIYNARNCGISVVMKIFLLYFRYWEWLENFAIYKGCLLRTKENFSHVMIIKGKILQQFDNFEIYKDCLLWKKEYWTPVMLIRKDLWTDWKFRTF